MTIEYLRSFRITNYAIFDLAVSFLGIYLLSPLLTKIFLKLNINTSTLSWLLLTLPLSILIHILVGNYTKMTQDFLDPSGHYYIKIFILTLLILGLKSVKLIKQ